MKIVGIICEYDPFHAGHLHQLREIRRELGEDTAILCAMSGSFVQRGLPAALHKTVRANAALACGADWVLELPTAGVLQSAEGFARTGVELLDRLGVVEYLSFGTESGDIRSLTAAAKAMSHEDFPELLHRELERGRSYGAAKQSAVVALTGNKAIITSPNDLLGAQYAEAIFLRNSRMKLLPVLRRGDHHAQTPDCRWPSSSSLRPLLLQGGWEAYVPEEARHCYENAERYAMQYGQRAVLAVLRSMTEEQWEQVAHGSEGLWRRAMAAARQASSWQELLKTAKTGRYPQTRLQRLFLCAYLGITRELSEKPIAFARTLGCSERGRELIRLAKKQGDLPLLHVGQQAPDWETEEQERRFSDLFALFSAGENGLKPGQERTLRISFAKK